MPEITISKICPPNQAMKLDPWRDKAYRTARIEVAKCREVIYRISLILSRNQSGKVVVPEPKTGSIKTD